MVSTPEEAAKQGTAIARVQPQNANSIVQFLEVAKVFSTSDLVPAAYKHKPANCLIAADIANRLGVSTIAVMQNLYPISGRISWSSQFIIAMINSCGKFSNLQFAMSGEGDLRSCVAFTKNKDGERLESPAASVKMAKAEGWFGKNGSKWQTMPELMLQYRAASFFGKLHCPELLFGMLSQEEAEELPPVKQSQKDKTDLTGIVGGEQQAESTDTADATDVTSETVGGEQPTTTSAATETTQSEPEKAKRTRRTKAEIEAAKESASDTAAESAPTTQVAAAIVPVPEGTPMSTQPQISRLKSIGNGSGKIMSDRWLGILAKRRNVTSEAGLTFAEAAELIANLEAKYPDLKKDADDVPFDAADPAEADPTNAAVVGKATQAQVDDMISYRNKLGIPLAKWREILAKKGVSFEGDLSFTDADVFLANLSKALKVKQDKESLNELGNSMNPTGAAAGN